jgi:protein gp37
MGETTNISWTDHTFNPWDGCTHAKQPDGTDAPECENCYAEATDNRFHAGAHWGPHAPRKTHSDEYWRKPLLWNKRAAKDGVRRRVFCASQADVFEERRGDVGLLLDALRLRLFDLIQDTPYLDWLLLTKRPENAAKMVPWVRGIAGVNAPSGLTHHGAPPFGTPVTISGQPCPNVWLGTTCGVRASLHRIEMLRRIPAAVHFVSCEPILDHITAEDWDYALRRVGPRGLELEPRYRYPIDWLIVGDESGRKRRPAEDEWIRTARDAAVRHSVAFHNKQRHIDGKKIHLPILDGRQWAEFPK